MTNSNCFRYKPAFTFISSAISRSAKKSPAAKNVCLEKTAFEVKLIFKSPVGRLFAIQSLKFLHVREVEIPNQTNLVSILSITGLINE